MSTRYIDVFNGDADGLCALIQLYRDKPRDAQIITGVKRDINLLQGLEAVLGDHITVLDISFDKNRDDVGRLLQSGASIHYVDHHKTGELFTHPHLKTDIDLSPETCTSLLVNKQLQGKYHAWAITAAFGDNLGKQAKVLGMDSGLNASQLLSLEKLGTYLNYNGYGASVEDLFFSPEALFHQLKHFDNPFDFLQQTPEVFATLENGYEDDMQKAGAMPFEYCDDGLAVLVLPAEKWARRVSGVFSNALTNQSPDRAHAVLTEKENGHYVVSLRAPLNRRTGADEVASQFPTGGGRKAAAGINDLPPQNLDTLITQMQKQYGGL